MGWYPRRVTNAYVSFTIRLSVTPSRIRPAPCIPMFSQPLKVELEQERTTDAGSPTLSLYRECLPAAVTLMRPGPGLKRSRCG